MNSLSEGQRNWIIDQTAGPSPSKVVTSPNWSLEILLGGETYKGNSLFTHFRSTNELNSGIPLSVSVSEAPEWGLLEIRTSNGVE